MAKTWDSKTRSSLLRRLAHAPTNEAAWKEFVEQYSGKIYSWCRQWNLQQADALDVTQNVLVKLFRKMSAFEYDPSHSFRAWLKTVTHHAWRDFVQSQQRAGCGNSAGPLDELLCRTKASTDLVDHLEDEFDQEILAEAMRRVQLRVAPPTWEAFRLTALEDLSGLEVSQRIDMRVGQVFVAKHRVQKLLQEEVRKLEGSCPRVQVADIGPPSL